MHEPIGDEGNRHYASPRVAHGPAGGGPTTGNHSGLPQEGPPVDLRMQRLEFNLSYSLLSIMP